MIDQDRFILRWMAVRSIRNARHDTILARSGNGIVANRIERPSRRVEFGTCIPLVAVTNLRVATTNCRADRTGQSSNPASAGTWTATSLPTSRQERRGKQASTIVDDVRFA